MWWYLIVKSSKQEQFHILCMAYRIQLEEKLIWNDIIDFFEIQLESKESIGASCIEQEALGGLSQSEEYVT